MIETVLALVASQFLGWVFLTAGLDKIRHRSAFEDELALTLPSRWVIGRTRSAIAAGVCIVELILGGAALAGVGGAATPLACASLLTLFAVLRLRTVQQAQSCGCGGIIEALPQGRSHVIVNGLLTGAALWTASVAPTVAWWSQPSAISVVVVALVALLLLSAATAWAIRKLARARQLVDVQRGVA